MCKLSEESGYDEGSVAMSSVPYAPPVDLCKLRKCGHMMHRACLLMLLKSESSKVCVCVCEVCLHVCAVCVDMCVIVCMCECWLFSPTEWTHMPDM